MPSIVTSPLETEEERRIAGEAFAQLRSALDSHRAVRFETDEVHIRIPERMVGLLLEVFRLMSQGSAVALLPYNLELTTQEAADILNVSRPFLVKLCDQGKLPYSRPGRHRRIRIQDLLKYRRDQEDKQARILDELVTESQELGLEYH